MSAPSLLDPYDLAGIRLANRLVMAPMTRARAADGVPNGSVARYYAQRAGAGLIVSEGAPVSSEGTGFLFVPGMYSDRQIEAWRSVTDAVRAAGGVMFAQLWHVGRVSHVSLQADGAPPVGASSRPGGSAFAYDEAGQPAIVASSPPRALETAELPRVTGDFALAAERAIAAGFDGVEVHGANGYLFEQFLNPQINDRADVFGGPVENRARLLIETVRAIASRIGASRVGVRLSPFSFMFDVPAYESAGSDYLYVAEQLGRIGIAYLHFMDQGAVSEGFDRVGAPRIDAAFLGEIRRGFPGSVILAGGLDCDRGQALLDAGLIDLVAMGRPFIANPDLVERLRRGLPLAAPDPDTFYGGDDRGYTDYPAWAATGRDQ